MKLFGINQSLKSTQLWTGAEVEFTEEAGTEFSFWDGDIVGKNIEVDPGKKLYSDGILAMKENLLLQPSNCKNSKKVPL